MGKFLARLKATVDDLTRLTNGHLLSNVPRMIEVVGGASQKISPRDEWATTSPSTNMGCCIPTQLKVDEQRVLNIRISREQSWINAPKHLIGGHDFEAEWRHQVDLDLDS